MPTDISTRPAPHLARTLARSLSGYLCGTHSGVLRRGREDLLSLPALAGAHQALTPAAASTVTEPHGLGTDRWRPPEGARRLRAGLLDALDASAVVDLILYGSQARGSTTHYSDVDAILVVSDETAADPDALRSLRARVLRAQRQVLDHQPMQHHAFEVATPSLLRDARAALDLPPEAVMRTASLFGRGSVAAFGPATAQGARARLRSMIAQLGRVAVWPRHPWTLHRLLSMFELVPALFLQSEGQVTAKSRSFALAHEQLGDAWRPYDTLREVRERWPDRRYPALRALLRAHANPWVGVAVWRRAPVTVAGEIRALLTPAVLADLHRALGLMASGAAR